MIELQITSIKAPTFCINNRVDINEYELRQMMADVAKGKIPYEDITSVVCNQSGIELGLREDGMLAEDSESLQIIHKSAMELLFAQERN